jgi:single-strand DNA-binding protein
VNDTIVTVVGNVVDSPRRATAGSSVVTNFRMAATARRYDAARQEFVDAGTLWVDVECWNTLSGNVSASLSKGDPVIVHGALTTHEWESDSGPRSKPRIRAFAVGPNLQKGRSMFTRDRSSARSAEQTDAEQIDAEQMAPFGSGPEEFSTSDAELLAGRDYEVEDEALDSGDADLPREPAHA